MRRAVSVLELHESHEHPRSIFAPSYFLRAEDMFC
jgi:hypothetical protein